MKDNNDEKIVLTLFVPSLEDTVAWYENVLGWSAHYDIWDDQGKGLFGSVAYRQDPFVGLNISRRPGNAELSGEKCEHVQVWIYVKNVDAIHDRVSKHGYDFVEPPKGQFWGERIFRMYDLNGVELIFSQSVEQIDLAEIRRRHKSLPDG